MKTQWIIKDQQTGAFFSLLGSAHFTSNIDIAQRFDSERDAILCEEEQIHNEEAFLQYDTMPAEFIADGMTVKFREPEEDEENDLYEVIDASDQDRVLIRCTNSSLALPPVESINSVDLTVVES